MKQVSIDEARELQQLGTWEDNPKYDPNNRLNQLAQQKKIFRAKYTVHWRPNPILPEERQYAEVGDAL